MFSLWLLFLLSKNCLEIIPEMIPEKIPEKILEMIPEMILEMVVSIPENIPETVPEMMHPLVLVIRFASLVLVVGFVPFWDLAVFPSPFVQ